MTPLEDTSNSASETRKGRPSVFKIGPHCPDGIFGLMRLKVLAHRAGERLFLGVCCLHLRTKSDFEDCCAKHLPNVTWSIWTKKFWRPNLNWYRPVPFYHQRCVYHQVILNIQDAPRGKQPLFLSCLFIALMRKTTKSNLSRINATTSWWAYLSYHVY
jgi:hypothetical protein